MSLKYLRKEDYINGDRKQLNDLGIKLYLKQIKDLVRQGMFFIVPREDNDEFIYKYNLTEKKLQKKMLLDLKESDFRYEDDDKDAEKYGPEKVTVFIKSVKLRDLNYKECNVDIYIKIKMKENKLPIISFHENNKKGL